MTSSGVATYARDARRRCWRAGGLVGLVAVCGTMLVGWAVGAALVVIGVCAAGATFVVKKATARWPATRAQSGLGNKDIEAAGLGELADAAEALLTGAARAPADLRSLFLPLVALCAEIVRRSVALGQLAQRRRQHLQLLAEADLVRRLERQRARLLAAPADTVAYRLTDKVEALAQRLSSCASHRAAIARTDTEIEAAKQTLLAAAAQARHLVSCRQAAALVVAQCDDQGTELTRRLLVSRLSDLESALGELS